MKTRHLFGTDGIRGVAGEYPLNRPTAFAFGIALGEWALRNLHGEVLLGMDTRESGTWLAEHVAGGLKKAGVQPRFAGVITTPGVAYLVRMGDFAAGVMISASHNPFHDNGLKAFDHSGFKLPDEQEHAIEQRIFELAAAGLEPQPVELSPEPSLTEAYIDYLVSTVPENLNGLKLVLDCANGACFELAPKLFERLGAEVETLSCAPDGRNINLNCGALHVEALREEVVRRGADVGCAFDGDADRCILVSAGGRIVDGDSVLLIVAGSLKAEQRLRGDMVVATVMSNLGLERALNAGGIQMVRTPVGDKYVLEEMIRRDAVIGGEQSGHVIFREFATTGDGLLTAAQILKIVHQTGKSLDELSRGLEVYPQLLLNVRVKTRKPLADLPNVEQEIRSAEQDFGDTGRVLVRFSGTEPLARVMVEGADRERVHHFAQRIADAIRAELG